MRLATGSATKDVRVRRNIITLGAALVVTLLAASCSSTATGAPSSSATTSATTETSTTDLAGAPHIANPLDTSKAQQNPCGTVQTAQLTALGIGTTPKVTSTTLGPACTWSGSDTATRTNANGSVTFLTAGSGLSSVYSARSTYAVFQVWPAVDGYPAVSALPVDERPHGNCDVTVGVSDSLALDVSYYANDAQYKSDPCGAAQRLASDAVSNIKDGG